MKQIWPNYSYSPTTNVLTLTGLNIDRDQLLLVSAPERGRIMYNFADSSVTASAFTAGANTGLTLVASTAGLTTTAALVIYYDDQLTSTTVTVSSLPAISGTVTVGVLPSLENNTDFVNVGAQIAEGINAELGVYVRVEPSNSLPISGTVTVGNTVTIAGTVTANPTGTQTIAGSVTASISGTVPVSISSVTVGNSVDFIGSGYSNLFDLGDSGNLFVEANVTNFPATQVISGTVTIGNTVTIAGTVTANPTGTQTIAGSVTIGAGTAQIGSVTASISGTVPVSGTFFQTTQPVSLATLPTLAAGTAQIGSVTASISNSVTIGSLPAISGTVTANTFALQGTAVTTSNFTSTTASTVLANYNATRQVLTIFNEGAGNLHISPGATCTTIAYQVRLGSGDYYEVPNHQTTITHSAVFATAGTARVTQVS